MRNNETVTVEFLRDALNWLNMLNDTGVASGIHGLELQQEMDERYPAVWMAILYEIGQFEEEKEDPYMRGYNDFHAGKDTGDNPYPWSTEPEDNGQWEAGWLDANAGA